MKHELTEAAIVIQDLLKMVFLAVPGSGDPAIGAAQAYLARLYGAKKTDRFASLLDDCYAGFCDDAVDTAKLLVLQAQADGLKEEDTLQGLLECVCSRIMQHVPTETFRSDSPKTDAPA